MVFCRGWGTGGVPKLRFLSFATNALAVKCGINTTGVWKSISAKRAMSTTMNSDSRPNRLSFSLKNYDVIGFDLDHTLARYRMSSLYRLCYNAQLEHLIKTGYPKQIFRDYNENQFAFCQKGIVYDKERGNLLKLGENHEVVQCFHGTKPLSNEEIQKIYGANAEIVAILKQMPFIRDHTPEDVVRSFHCFGDSFTVGTIYLLMEIIDAMDKGELTFKDYAKPFRDFFEGYCNMYRREAFREHSGYFFPEMKTKTAEMLYPCSPEILEWLKQLRRDGMKTAVVTSSNADYAELLLNYTVGKNWMDYFDSVVTWARKPGFWTQPDRMFYSVKDHREGDPVGKLKDKTVYAQGSFEKLNELFKQLTGKEQPKVVYVGDSLVDDMYVPQKYNCCDTIGIVEEMEPNMVGDPSEWGHFLKVKGSERPSFWSTVVSKSCKLAVPSVQEMARYPRDFVFDKSTDTYLVFN